jgi:hypothetical protein
MRVTNGMAVAGSMRQMSTPLGRYQRALTQMATGRPLSLRAMQRIREQGSHEVGRRDGSHQAAWSRPAGYSDATGPFLR